MNQNTPNKTRFCKIYLVQSVQVCSFFLFRPKDLYAYTYNNHMYIHTLKVDKNDS